MKFKESGRRRFLKNSAALAGLALGTIRSAVGETPEPDTHEGHSTDLKELIAYGERSRFVKSVRVPEGASSGSSPDKFGLTHHVLTPLQDQLGMITPSPLHYIATHRGVFVPDIDPQQHRLTIHGMVDRPLEFSVEELKRLPLVSRIHYLECNANKPKLSNKTVQESHGRTSCSEWTGVPLSVLLKEAGVQSKATWIVAEGSDNNKGSYTIPLAKVLEDALVAYGQNGEPIRPHQGFPLRLLVPGFEGINSVKWLRRIKLVDEVYMTFNEYDRYTSRQDPRANSFNFEQGPKSVITFPSGDQKLPGRGFYEIAGLAWSGGGVVRKVEISTDGGRTWKDAPIKSAAHRMAHTRFAMDWNWDGRECVLLSRCTDELGQVQPSIEQFAKFWKVTPNDLLVSTPVSGHYNFMQPWKVTSNGSVENAFA